jgi:hypothetical protein
LPIGIAHFTPSKGGKRLSNFCWLLADRNSLIFKPLKEGEMLVNFWGGVFLVACRSELAHFKTPEGGKRSPIFWLLADRNSLIF